MSDLASSIEVLNPINRETSKSNLHTPLRYSAVLLSIGKTTHICHQNIPLKKIHCKKTVTYVSAIPRKLAKSWQQPTGEIASQLVAVLQRHPLPSVWSTVRCNDEHWIEFVISHHGIEQWRRQLIGQLGSRPVTMAEEPVLATDTVWRLQAGYELCCRWQTLHHTAGPNRQSAQRETPDHRPFQPPAVLRELVHELLELGDRWEEATAPQLLHQVRGLVAALEQCTRATPPSSPTAPQLSHWLTPTQIILHQLLHQRWGYPLPGCF